MENASVYVNCTTASANVNSQIQSKNTSLVHFPSGVDMSNPNLVNITTLWLAFTTAYSYLSYEFNGTTVTTARSISDEVTPTLEGAFQTIFTWNSTDESGGTAKINYIGLGKQNLTQYTEGLMSLCLASDLEGFSLTFLPISHKPDALEGVLASKDSGSFDWTYYVTAGYLTSVSTGSGNHMIDILALLSVNSIAPSPYANAGSLYNSRIAVYIVSDEPVSFEACQPEEAPPSSRGWFIYPNPPLHNLTAMFNFGNDISPVSPLTFTFGGEVVPEFPSFLILPLLMAATLLAVMIIRRKHRANLRIPV